MKNHFKNQRANIIKKLLWVESNVKLRFSQYLLKQDKRTFKILLGVFSIGILLTVLVGVLPYLNEGAKDVEKLKRYSYQRGDYQTELKFRVQDKGWKEEALLVEVPKRIFTEREVEGFFKSAIEILDKYILDRNKSLDYIEYDLDLVTEIPNNPVCISWISSRVDVIDWEGRIGQNIPREGVWAKLYGRLEYEERVEEIIKEVKVFPKRLNDKDEMKRKVQYEIEKINEGTQMQDYLLLPNQIDGKKLVWLQEESINPKGVLLLTLIAMVGVLVGRRRENEVLEKKKEAQMDIDYPEILSKLTLLLGAGLSCRKAFERITNDYKNRIKLSPNKRRFAYEVIASTYYEIEGKGSERLAYQGMGSKTSNLKYKTLGNLLSQNLQRGSQGMLEILENETLIAFEERKRKARIQGEEAGTKLLFPMMLMLLIILVILIIPAYLSF